MLYVMPKSRMWLLGLIVLSLLKDAACEDAGGSNSGKSATLYSIGADFRFEVPGQSSVGLIGGGRGQWLGGHHGECGARAYIGCLEAEPPAGSRGRAPGQGVRGAKPPKAESILVIGCPTEPANLAPLVKFSK